MLTLEMYKWLNQAIDYALANSHESLASIAVKLGIGYSTLDKWIRLVNPKGSSKRQLSPEQQRIIDLEKEVKQLKEVRFFGTATNVDRLANFVSEKNKYVDPITGKPTEVYSAVHYTDFVGCSPLLFLRSPWIVGGKSPTGGIENTWFTYSHSGYDMNIPEKILKDAQGFNIDKNGYRTNTVENKNPYLKKHDELWNEGQKNNLVPKDRENPSLPILVKPKSSKTNEYKVPLDIK